MKVGGEIAPGGMGEKVSKRTGSLQCSDAPVFSAGVSVDTGLRRRFKKVVRRENEEIER